MQSNWLKELEALYAPHPIPAALRAYLGATAHTNPSLSQVGFRLRNDDGSQTTATWVANENTNASLLTDTNYRVRFVIDETAGGSENNVTFRLQYNLNGAGYVNVTDTSSVVRATASTNLTDDEATTRQLASGSGTFLTGRVDEVDGVTNTGVSWTSQQITEVEYCFQIRSVDVNNNDTIQMRVVRSNGTVLEGYTQTPSITVNEAAPFAPVVNAYRFYEDGTENGSTPIAAENTNLTNRSILTDSKVHLRVRIQETGGGTSGQATDDYGLQYRKNGGAWTIVTILSNDVRADTASGLVDAAASTNRATNGISDGTGSFVAGEQTEVGTVSDHQLTAGNFTEHVYAFFLRSADLVHGDSLEFRISRNGGDPGITNSVTPSIGVIIPAFTPVVDAFRFYEDGTESGSTPLAAENTSLGGSGTALLLSRDQGTDIIAPMGIGQTYQGWAAQIIGNGSTVIGARWYGERDGSPTGDLHVKIYSNGAGAPSSELASGSRPVQDLTQVPGTPVPIDVFFDTPIVLTAGTTYWLAYEYDGGDSTNYANIYLNNNVIADASLQSSTWAPESTGSIAQFQLFHEEPGVEGDQPAVVTGNNNLGEAGPNYARSSFATADRLWTFFVDTVAGDLFYNSAPIGGTWGTPTDVGTANTGLAQQEVFAVHYDGTFVHVAIGCSSTADGQPIRYRRGTPNSDGTITWSAAEQIARAAAAGIHYIEIGITVDSSGRPWISYEEDFGDPYVVTSTATDGTWSTRSGFPFQVATPGETTWTQIAALENDQVLVFYWTNTNISTRLWNGTGWDSAEAIAATDIPSSNVSVGSNGVDKAYLAWLPVSIGSPSIMVYTSGVGWGSEIPSGITASVSELALSIDSSADTVYLFFVDGLSTFAYRRFVAGSWESINIPINAPQSSISASEQDYNGRILLRYLDTNTTPDQLRIISLKTSLSGYEISGNTKVHLRVRVQETGGLSGASTDDYALQYRKNGGTWTNVTASSSDVQADTTSSLTDGGVTTNRATNGLADGTGTFVAGEQEEANGVIEDRQLTANNYTEHVWALLLIDADLADGDLLEFRVTLNAGSPGITNSVTPSITITKAASNNITGTLARTNANDVLSASGKVIVEGTVARTNANDTSNVSAKVRITGTVAVTNANDTSTASGKIRVLGTLARTNANDTLNAAGDVDIDGTLAKTNANDTSNASGKVSVKGTSAAANANDTSSASGTVEAPAVTGTLATVNADDTSNASGTVGNNSVTGTLAVTNASDTSNAAGKVRVTGSLATANGGDSSNASGVVNIAGTLAQTNQDDTSSASGTLRTSGTLARTNISDTSNVTAKIRAAGTLSRTNGSDSSTASGIVQNAEILRVVWAQMEVPEGAGIAGSIARTEAGDTMSASGKVNIAGTLARTNANDTMSASGTSQQGISGSLAETNAADTSNATGRVRWVGTLARSNQADTSNAAGKISVKGTSAQTGNNDTSNVSAKVSVKGSLARTNGNDTMVATSSAVVTGTMARTGGSDTLTASAKIRVIGSMARTGGTDTSNASGKLRIIGSMAQTAANDSLNATGDIDIDGSMARSNANDTMQADGSVGDVATGSLATTNADGTMSASGKVRNRGFMNRTTGNDTLNASGRVNIDGSMSVTGSTDVMSGAAKIRAIGALARVNAPDVSTILGKVSVKGSMARTAANDTSAFTGKISYKGTMARTAANDFIVASGKLRILGFMAVTERRDTSTSFTLPDSPEAGSDNTWGGQDRVRNIAADKIRSIHATKRVRTARRR